jgi:hypothetical protein
MVRGLGHVVVVAGPFGVVEGERIQTLGKAVPGNLEVAAVHPSLDISVVVGVQARRRTFVQRYLEAAQDHACFEVWLEAVAVVHFDRHQRAKDTTFCFYQYIRCPATAATSSLVAVLACFACNVTMTTS